MSSFLAQEGVPRGNRFAKKSVLSMWAYCLMTWGDVVAPASVGKGKLMLYQLSYSRSECCGTE